MSLPPSVLRVVQTSSDPDPFDPDSFNKKAKPTKPILLRIFPFAEEMRTMSLSTLRADFMAGLSVPSVAIPQVMAYAVVAGLPPQYGLYAATFAVMVAVLWGSSRFLTAGPTNAISMILFATIAHALGQFAERCHAESIPLILVTNNESIRGTLQRTGVLEHIGEDFVVPTLDDGLNFAKHFCKKN